MKRPIILILIAYIFGILIFEYININFSLILILSIVLIIVYSIYRKNAILLVIFLSIGVLSIQYRYPSNINLNSNQNLLLQILNKKETDYSFIYETKIINANHKNLKLISYYEIEFEVDDIIEVNGKLQIPNSKDNFNTFNNKKYLKSKNIHYEFKIKNSKLIKNLNTISNRIKTSLHDLFTKTLNPNSSYLLDSMILANSGDDQLKEDFRKTGLGHVLAVSGLHLSILIAFLEFIGRYLAVSKKIYGVFIVIILFLYGKIISFPVSLIRSITMYIISMFAIYTNNVKDELNSIFLTILIVLILNPFYIYSMAFYLSFSSLLGIYYINKKLSLVFVNIPKEYLLPVSIQISIFPFIIYSFNEISLFSILANLILIPIISFGLIVGFIYSISRLFLLTYLIDGIFQVIEWALIPIKWINEIFLINFPSPSPKSIILYYLILIILLNFKFIIYKIKKNNYGQKIIFSTILIILKLSFTNNIYIDFIDIGQGDSVLIRSNKHTIIYDTGGSGFNTESAGKHYYDYLFKNNVLNIDALIISHGDIDHYGNLHYISDKIKIKKLFSHPLKGFKTNPIKANSDISFENIKGNIILNRINLDSTNDSSIVLLFQIFGKNLLLTGDIEESEDKIHIKEKIDFLKVSHHGSKHSTRDKFLNKHEIKSAFISAGKNNRYGHPSKEVLDRLKKRHIDVYRTDQDGNIQIILNPYGYIIRRYNQKYNIIDLVKMLIIY